MTEFKEYDVQLRFEGTVSVKVPKDAPEPFSLAKSIAMDSAELIPSPTKTDEGFYSWCDAIDVNMGYDECSEKYGNLYYLATPDTAKINDIEWSGF